MISDKNRTLFNSYAAEFENGYLLEPAGQRHKAAYGKERAEVQQYWSDIKSAKVAGRDVTEQVLSKLLPYSNTRHNREKGYRISTAPAITKDLRKWFENAGWQESNNWDHVADAIYDLVFEVVENANWGALASFEANQNVSKGFKSGFLTPTLYFLDSARFRIVNSKTIDTFNFLLGPKAIGRDLSHYKEYVLAIDQALAELGNPLLLDRDVADEFCHWMCDRRLGGYARIEVETEPTVEEEEGTPAFEQELPPQGHWEAIYYIVKAGNLLGYKTYVADPSRLAFEKKLGELASLNEVPPILKSAPHISKVDAIWYRPTPPFFLFEVEDGGTMREALHRLYNAMGFDARFIVVSPIENRDKFEKWVATAPFKEFEERYNFRTYAELFEFYKQTVQFTSTRGRFLRA